MWLYNNTLIKTLMTAEIVYPATAASIDNGGGKKAGTTYLIINWIAFAIILIIPPPSTDAISART